MGPTFSPNLEALFNEGTARLTESEVRIWHMWRLVGKGFKPWEIETDYEPDERIIKLEDKADLFKLDEFEYNAQKAKKNKKDSLLAMQKELGLGFGKAKGFV